MFSFLFMVGCLRLLCFLFQDFLPQWQLEESHYARCLLFLFHVSHLIVVSVVIFLADVSGYLPLHNFMVTFLAEFSSFLPLQMSLVIFSCSVLWLSSLADFSCYLPLQRFLAIFYCIVVWLSSLVNLCGLPDRFCGYNFLTQLFFNNYLSLQNSSIMFPCRFSAKLCYNIFYCFPALSICLTFCVHYINQFFMCKYIFKSCQICTEDNTVS